MARIEHTATTVARARELADAGFSRYRIQQLLAREGISVTRSTLSAWLDPAYAAHRNRRSRDDQREYRQRGRGVALVDLVAAPAPSLAVLRVQALDEAGVPRRSIAKVMAVDFPDVPWSESRVRTTLERGELPRVYRKAA